MLIWLTELATADPRVELIWGTLDDPLRLAMAQSWLLNSGHVSINDPDRDQIADRLSAVDGVHPLFGRMYEQLLQHLRHVYSDIDGKPCLSDVTEVVSVDMELIAVSSEDQVGIHPAGAAVPMHSFFTRHVAGDDWVIAANARRLPVPGWPPSERTLEGLLIDGN